MDVPHFPVAFVKYHPFFLNKKDGVTMSIWSSQEINNHPTNQQQSSNKQPNFLENVLKEIFEKVLKFLKNVMYILYKHGNVPRFLDFI